jgi:GH15 family glucan-1,4-alpha-glucosidase
MGTDGEAWSLARHLVEFVAEHWQEPDEGQWEVRGPRQHFTHSKVMAWVAFDRAISNVERQQLDGPVDRWREIRAAIREDIYRHGFDAKRNTFTQYYGSSQVDSSLLMIPLVGFLPATDPRMLGTVAAIEQDLMQEGFLLRYPTGVDAEQVDGLPPGEGVFLACTFWLADNYALQGRYDEARRIFERLYALRNDLGLLSEQYDPARRRLVGNFPQAFSHVSFVNTARNLARKDGPAVHRHKAGKS